jgi:hypothetical protein
MSNTILIKRSSTANAVPTGNALAQGELAINLADGNLFYKNSADQVTVIASNKFVSVTGNVTGGNVVTGGEVSATGNITGNFYFGNGSQLTGVTATSVNAASLTGNTLSSNVTISSLTTVGTLTSVSVTGNVDAGNIITGGLISATGNISSANVISGTTISATGNITGNYFIGNGSQLTSITGGNVTGQVGNALVAGTVYTAAQPNMPQLLQLPGG